MSETSNYELILDTLVIMRRLFRSQSDSVRTLTKYNDQISQIIFQALNNEYSKVVSEGLRVSGSYMNVLKGANNCTIDPKYNGMVSELFNVVRSKLAKTDIDQEVKQCSIIAIASIVTAAHL